MKGSKENNGRSLRLMEVITFDIYLKNWDLPQYHGVISDKSFPGTGIYHIGKAERILMYHSY